MISLDLLKAFNSQAREQKRESQRELREKRRGRGTGRERRRGWRGGGGGGGGVERAEGEGEGETERETMTALYKYTGLNCWRKAFCCITNTLKNWSNFFLMWKFSVFYYNLPLSKSDTSLTTKQVVIGLWHYSWNNSRSDFGRFQLTFSHYTFQDVSFIFLFPWIQKHFFLTKG